MTKPLVLFKRDVIEFFDEFFDGTEMPFTDNKASIDKQYKDVMEVMGDMDRRIKLLESVCLRSTSEASAAVRVDLYKAIGWWRQAISRMYEADGDPGLGDGLDQVPEDE
ncbi:unnamed protein product [Clonostachys rhizophaga]|uniref:Uncharacterized protein n=1 Tax=Clonostachys rhizophaga TaxID=160324 RepID=A0A9N9VG13_9HYPO|nr:unnamed protein product [Clonostachys rhizophaga]